MKCHWQVLWPCTGKTVCGADETHVHECDYLEAFEFRDGKPIDPELESGHACGDWEERK